jgi:hypothetical protein
MLRRSRNRYRDVTELARPVLANARPACSTAQEVRERAIARGTYKSSFHSQQMWHDQFSCIVLTMWKRGRASREEDVMNCTKLVSSAPRIALIAGCATLGAPAFAQDPATADGETASQEIIITAQKREQNVLDVPVAVSVVNETVLDAAQV